MQELLNSVQTPSQAAVVCCAILVLIPVALYLGRTAIETVKSFGIRTRLDELADSLKDIREAIDENESLESLKKFIEERIHRSGIATAHLFAADLKELGKCIDTNFDTLKKDIADTTGSIHQSIVRLQQKVDSLERSGQSIVNSVNGIKTEGANRLQGIANKVETIVRHGEAIRSSHGIAMSEIRAELEKVHTAVDTLNTRLPDTPVVPAPSELPAATSAPEEPFLSLDDEAFDELASLPWDLQTQLPVVAPVLGQYGIQRDGTILDTPFEDNGDDDYPVTERTTGSSYTAEGWWSTSTTPHVSDIVSLNTKSGVAALRARIVELTSKGLPAPTTETTPCQDEPGPESL